MPSTVTGGRRQASSRTDPPPPPLTYLTFDTQSHAHRALGRHRELMVRSRALIERSRTLLGHAAGAPDRLSPERPPDGPASIAAGPANGAVRAAVTCAHAGCTNAASFRPLFVVSFGGRRVALPDAPMHVCAEHRDRLASLIRAPHVLESLRRLMRARGAREPASIRLTFQTLH